MSVQTQHRGLRLAPHRLVAVSMVLAGLALLLSTGAIRVGEAALQANLLRTLGVASDHYGATVLVRADAHWVGLALTTGCSVGPLLAVFLLGASPFVWWRNVPAGQVLWAVGQLSLVMVAANQIRIAIIAFSMRIWGVETGYELSHVFFGSAITTIGFVLGALLLARGLTRGSTRP